MTTSEELRLQRIEAALAAHATAIKNLASKRQLSHILSLMERQLQESADEITSLQTQIEALKK